MYYNKDRLQTYRNKAQASIQSANYGLDFYSMDIALNYSYVDVLNAFKYAIHSNEVLLRKYIDGFTFKQMHALLYKPYDLYKYTDLLNTLYVYNSYTGLTGELTDNYDYEFTEKTVDNATILVNILLKDYPKEEALFDED